MMRASAARPAAWLSRAMPQQQQFSARGHDNAVGLTSVLDRGQFLNYILESGLINPQPPTMRGTFHLHYCTNIVASLPCQTQSFSAKPPKFRTFHHRNAWLAQRLF